MDKFISKNINSNKGLDLLANQKFRTNSIISNNLSYKTRIKDFKEILISKIDRFDPKNNTNDYINNSLKLLWLEFITKNLNNDKLDEIYNTLSMENNK